MVRNELIYERGLLVAVDAQPVACLLVRLSICVCVCRVPHLNLDNLRDALFRAAPELHAAGVFTDIPVASDTNVASVSANGSGMEAVSSPVHPPNLVTGVAAGEAREDTSATGRKSSNQATRKSLVTAADSAAAPAAAIGAPSADALFAWLLRMNEQLGHE